MSQGRRTIDRRRRVLYSTQSDTGPSTVASRREAARLRQARRPAAAYGSRVHRRLRGRWFALVPVRRRTMSIAVGTIVTAAIMLCAAHYAAVTWPSIANRSEIARPLRLDRPDSFGRWFAGLLMIGSAGASFLIYQLRRHRLDDFRGHYRLWRLVLMVMILASLNSVVSLIDWSGALLDVAIGKRVAFSGADWIRIVVSVGGAVLALRLIAEVHRSRAALVAMLAAIGFFAIPEIVKWNVMQVETIERWTLVTSASLLAFTSLFVSFGIYLRMLYRQVRRLDETDSLKDRVAQMRLRLFDRSENQESLEQEPEADTESRRRWWNRKRGRTTEANSSKHKSPEKGTRKDESVQPKKRPPQPTAKPVVDEVSASKEQPQPKKRRWFGFRSAAPEASQQESNAASEDESQARRNKRRRFSLRLASRTAGEVEGASETPAEETNEPKPKRKFGLAGFRRQRAAEAQPGETSPSPAATQRNGTDDRDPIDPDQIDWNGLSKSERRRLRKQLKRQNKAA